MDRSRYKQPVKQTVHTTTQKTFGNTPPTVPKVLSTRAVAPMPRQPLAGQARTQPMPRAVQGGHSIPVRIGNASANRARVAATPVQPIPVITSQQRITPTHTQPQAAAQPAVAPAPVLARQLPIDMDLPGAESSWNPATVLTGRKWRRARTFASRGLAVAMVLVVMFGGVGYFKMNKVFKGGTETAAALKTDVAPELLKGEGRGRVNILLMGRGGGAHDAPDLTDTIMVASIDPVNKTASLVSIPRDLWVNVPGQGVMKLNAAYETGVYKYHGKVVNNTTDPAAIKAGFAMVDATVSEVLGLEIDYNVILNFQAFKQAVDTVGGVTMNVPADLVDPTMAWENANNPVLAKAGVQQFDGTKALIYSRSRETTSDFARGERQRAVIAALKTKIVSAGTLSNPVKMSGLMSAFGNNVSTDLSISNANRLYSIMKDVSDSSILSVSLADAQKPYVTTGNINGQSVVLPKAGLFKYDDIQAYLRGQLQDPYIMQEKAKVIVLNGTQTPGLASAKADELRSYGYNVVAVSNTPTPTWLHTTLVDMTHKKKYTKNYLEQRFGQTAASQLSDKTIATNGADFAIIIGSNEAATTQP
jgi:polyisoprenyl-teichoic acid--peptidoglycan teichoic acid transferase